MLKARNFILGLSVASLLALSAAPALAQVGDFFCSTFSIGCPPPPPPPPPLPPPVEEAPAPIKTKRKKIVKKKKVVAPKADATSAPQ